MIKKLLIVLISFFFSNNILAQDVLDWYGTSTLRVGLGDWYFDDKGGLYYVGAFGLDQDLDLKEEHEYIFKHPTTNEPSKGFGIIKYDLDGNLLWVKASPIEHFTSGSYFQIRYTEQKGDYIYIVGQLDDYKIAPDFNNFNDKINPTGEQDIVFLKYDLNGNLIKADKMFFSGYDIFFRIENFIVDENEDYHVAGFFRGEINFDMKNNSNAYYYDYRATAFYAHYSKDNNLIKHFIFEGNDVTCNGFDMDKDGNFYISGIYSGQMDLSPGTNSDFIADGGGGYIVKLDKNANKIWGLRVEDFNFYNLRIFSDNHMYITGNFSSNVNLNFIGAPTYFQPNINEGNTNGPIYTGATFIGKYDLAGGLQWAKFLSTNDGLGVFTKIYEKEGEKFLTFLGMGNYTLADGSEINLSTEDRNSALLRFNDTSMSKYHTLIDSYSLIYMNKKGPRLLTYGSYKETAAQIPEYDLELPVMDPTNIGAASNTSQYVAMFIDPNFVEEEVENPDSGPGLNSFFNIYPNPSYGRFVIESSGTYLGSSFVIFDELGKKIYEGKLNQIKTEVILNVSTGVYIVSVYKDKEIIKSHKIIIK